MGDQAYKKDSHVRKLVGEGDFEQKAAETNGEVFDDRVEEATETLASEDFVESEFRAQREYIVRELMVLKSKVADVKSDVADVKSKVADVKSDVAEIKSVLKEMNSQIAELRVEIAKLETRFTFVVFGIVALMQGLNWLLRPFG